MVVDSTTTIHRLKLVLSQCVSFMKPVKVFFASLSGFGTFFSKSTKRTEALDAEVKRRFPSVAPTRWNYNSRLLETVQNHKTDIENLFITINENGSDWDAETVCCTRGFSALLRDFDFNFFIAVFSAIFPHLDSLFQIPVPEDDTIVVSKRVGQLQVLIVVNEPLKLFTYMCWFVC